MITLNWTRAIDDTEAQLADDVMFAVDEDDNGDELAVIADVTRDDAWISMPLSAARTLSQHR
ncbi:DUF7556 family protein [Haladaptatus salinisoli]|uniref:DUF7556 family protein n=1 Tax=Haladaptatus salinisoli TaxID=2884876 RepID=UPI001D09CE7D|nr:hypothetical protein [Haladaptatus salinisoli]